MASTTDAAQGMYWWLVEHHSGQGSSEYRWLCRMNYTPALNETGPNTSPAVQVYNERCKRFGCVHELLQLPPRRLLGCILDAWG